MSVAPKNVPGSLGAAEPDDARLRRDFLEAEGAYHELARLEREALDGYRGAEPALMEHLADMTERGLEVDGTIVRTLVKLYRRGAIKVVTLGKRTDPRADELIAVLHDGFGFTDSQIADALAYATDQEIDPESIRKRRERLYRRRG